jgi:3-methyladenine DNA glycosylase AlkD
MPDAPLELTAESFVQALYKRQSDEELRKIQRYFKTGPGDYAEGDEFMGIRMGDVFATAKVFIDMEASELERVLESPIHEVRAGAMSIMDKQGRRKKTDDERRKELYELYLRRHDRINNWDLVDLGAPFVVGRYLEHRPRDVLYELAGSASLWERRTAIVATSYFIRQGGLDDTFGIAEMLVHDDEDMIQKPVGGWLRFAGDQDRDRLKRFLDKYAATMPRTALRYALEHFDKTERDHYMGLARNQ